MCDADNSDEDYDFHDGDHHHHISIEKKYPLHDCCEFDDVDTLRVRFKTAYSSHRIMFVVAAASAAPHIGHILTNAEKFRDFTTICYDTLFLRELSY
jgi:hypothetical protein